jgi:hypothetical protein
VHPDGLYITGFSATRDFGPFFGLVEGSPVSATLILGDLLSRNRLAARWAQGSQARTALAGRALIASQFSREQPRVIKDAKTDQRR